MEDHAGKHYRPWEPHRYAQELHSPASRLPEDDLVFFLLETVPGMDLSRFYAYYEDETRGAPPFDPAMMLCLLLYTYCVGVFSSRKIALACERNLAFLAIVGVERPDFRTISDFRKIHLDAFVDLFVQVLQLAAAAGLIRLGNISIDGTKIQGNASRHKAMSYGYMKKEEQRLKAEIAALIRQAQEQDATEDAVLGCRRGDELPEELRRREQRLAVIQAAKQRLEEEARVAAEAERQRRQETEAERERRGQKARGKPAKPVQNLPDDKAQVNFTDPELAIMKANNKGWDLCGNAQASVDGANQIILACDVTDAPNDKQQAVPMGQATLANLAQAGIERPHDEAGQEQKIPATLDNGYYSEAAAKGMEEAGFDPYIATGRQKHHAVESETEKVVVPETAEPKAATATTAFVATALVVAALVATDAAEAVPQTPPAPRTRASAATSAAAAKEKMAAKLRTPAGRALYARRKAIVEPVFGQIKGARGFRRFLLRGLAKVRGEWRLVCLTHNLLKIWRYRCAPTGK
jgi:transposase